MPVSEKIDDKGSLIREYSSPDFHLKVNTMPSVSYYIDFYFDFPSSQIYCSLCFLQGLQRLSKGINIQQSSLFLGHQTKQ